MRASGSYTKLISFVFFATFVTYSGCARNRDSDTSSASRAKPNVSETTELTATQPAPPPPAPTWCPQTWANGQLYSKSPKLQNDACWYLGSSRESCTNVCSHFYGVDTLKMPMMVNNPDLCDSTIRAMNPQQAGNYIKTTPTLAQAPAGAACAWTIIGKFPNAKWYTSSGKTYSATASSPAATQVCACQTYQFPRYNGLGLTYRASTGTTGKAGVAMKVRPTYLTGSINDVNSYTNGTYGTATKITGCVTDVATPLPKGLTLNQSNCEISGTPTAALAQPVTITVFAINSSYNSDSIYGRSNPAPVTLNITN